VTDQPLILAFDTSAAHCAAVLLCGDLVLGRRDEPMAKGQAERLMPLLAELMAEAGRRMAELDAIAVGTGPGNFTGIRLSVAAARGLALSLGVPAIGVSVLEALAEAGPRPMLAVLDARRGAAYVQRFDADGPGEPRLEETPDALPAGLPRIGDLDGAAAPALPVTEAIARIAARRLGTEAPRPAPLYLRAADAAPSRSLPPPILP